MYLDGRTQGKPWHAEPVDTNNPALERAWQRVKSTGSWANCTSADAMRLRRLPKWVRFASRRTDMDREERKQWRASCGNHRRWYYEAMCLARGTITFDAL